jgi:hypothetical protein
MAQEMNTETDVVISIEQAAQDYDTELGTLRFLIECGAIQAVQTPDGQTLVSLEDLDRVRIPTLPLDRLEGQPIHLSQAARKYDLSTANLTHWRQRDLIKTLGKQGNKIMLNEKDVAYIRLVIDCVGLKNGQALEYAIEQFEQT